MAGGSDEAASEILSTVLKHPLTAASMIAAVAFSVYAWASVRTDISKINDLVVQDRDSMRALTTRVDKVEEKTAEKLEKVQSDVSDVKATVKGIDASIQILIRRDNNSSSPR